MIRFASSSIQSRVNRCATLTLLRTGSHKLKYGMGSTTLSSYLHTVSLQLDYYMSSQFAGIACAMTNQLYEKNGVELKFLPICPVGTELERVRENTDAHGASCVTVGSVEQNIFIPTLYRGPELKVKAAAAMFRRSPLCLASLDPLPSEKTDGNTIIGAHEDTVWLFEKIFSSGPDKGKFSVIASPRPTKNTDLITGKLDGIQVYSTTEVPTLARQLGKEIIAPALEGMNGAKLGYAQVLFAPEEDLACPDKRAVVQSFLDATFRGWEMAIQDPESGARSVDEVRSMIGLDEESNDHWDSSFSYTVQSVGLCSDFVKETFQGGRYGVIDADRWNEAAQWLLPEGAAGGDSFGLDAELWQPHGPQL